MIEIEQLMRQIAEINGFIKERVDPLSGDVKLLQEELERVGAAIADAQKRDQDARRRSLLASADRSGERLRVRGGKYEGCSLLDMAIVRSVLSAQVRDPRGYDATRLRTWEEGVTRAMDSTTAGAGDELVPTLLANELWMDVNLATAVASLFQSIPMPSNPFDIPLQLGDMNWYPGAANVATTSTDPTTAKRTLTAYELAAMVAWAYELDEDAVIAMLPSLRASLVRNAAEVLDDVILNADTTVTNGINSDGATISTSDAGKAQWLIGFNGLRHIPLVDNTGQANDHNAAASADMFNEIRSKLGKYGVRPSELAWIVDLNTYIRAQSIEEFQTLDKFGPQATILTGQLGAVEGIPVIVSEQMRLTAADGKVTDGTAGTVGGLLLVNRSQYMKGFKRELLIETERDIQKRQNVMVASMRVGWLGRNTPSADTATALQYNVTGVV